MTDRTRLCNILGRLLPKGSKHWGAHSALRKLGMRLPTDPELRTLLAQKDEVFALPNPGVVKQTPSSPLCFPIQLEVKETNWLPLLTMRWDYRTGKRATAPPERAVRIFLVNTRALNRTSDGLVRVHIVRFDDAEVTGSYRFAHSQLCDAATPYEAVFAPAPSWVCGTLPRVALPTQKPDAVALLTAAMASLHGTRARSLGSLTPGDLTPSAKQLLEFVGA